MTSSAKTVAGFPEQLPADRRAILEPLVETVRRVAPPAAESPEFRMPTWKLGEEIVCALNSQRNYVSFYISDQTQAECAALLKGRDCGKVCIRFRRAEQLPPAAVAQPLKVRLRQLGPHRC
jgi:uncharacterized protein YdhG (YjbR/CyaY superfamily)